MNRICFVNSSIQWGGGEKWHFDAASYLHRKKYPVLVICHPKSELRNRLEKTDIPFHTVNIGNLSFINPLLRKQLKNIFITERVQTVVLNLSRDLKSGGLSAKKAGVSRIIYRRGSAIPIKNSAFNRYLFRSVVDEVLVNSKATADTVLYNNPALFPKDKMTVIPNSIDLEKYTSTDDLIYHKENDELVLVSLGRLEIEKNHYFLLDVAAELKRKEIPFKLIIGGSGSLYQKLQTQIDTLNLGDDVKLLGFIDEPWKLLQSGDIFLLPSLWEGFGYVLAEAGACKLPIVAFNTGSIPEIVQDGQTGILTNPGDIASFTEAICKLYYDASLRKTMGESGLIFVSTHFNRERVNNVLESYLTD